MHSLGSHSTNQLEAATSRVSAWWRCRAAESAHHSPEECTRVWRMYNWTMLSIWWLSPGVKSKSVLVSAKISLSSSIGSMAAGSLARNVKGLVGYILFVRMTEQSWVPDVISSNQCEHPLFDFNEQYTENGHNTDVRVVHTLMYKH